VSGPAGMAAGLGGVLAAGGVAALASRNAEVIRKWRTWAVSAPLVAGCLWLGGPGAALLAAGLGVTGAVEYGRLVRLRAADVSVIAAAAVVLPLVAWRMPGELGRVLAGAALAVALVPVLGGDAAAGARRAAAGVFGVAWLAALSGLVLLGKAALPLAFAVSVADVGAWCAGKALGGPAVSALSPAKRWSGVAGGALAGVAALAAATALSGGGSWGSGFGGGGVFTLGHVIAVAAGAPLGDLLESMVKRGAGAKDAGSWLPGFGGLLDRIDSLLVVLALAVIL
jgi:phosphatidate cytidylyltransferase